MSLLKKKQVEWFLCALLQLFLLITTSSCNRQPVRDGDIDQMPDNKKETTMPIEKKREDSQRVTQSNSATPEWMNDLPPKGTMEFNIELSKRITDSGPIIKAVAEVDSFSSAVLDGLGEAPEKSVSVSGTQVKILSPAEYAGKNMFILHGDASKIDANWKSKGKRVEFSIRERLLQVQWIKQFRRLIYSELLRDLKWL